MSNVNFPPGIPALQIAGRVFTDLTNLLVFAGTINGATNRYCSPRLYSGTAGYQVTSGKSLVIWAVATDISVAGTSFMGVGYCDNDVGMATNTAPTNPIYQPSSASLLAATGLGVYATGVKEFATKLIIPTGKFLLVDSVGGTTVGTVKLFGYEV